jgi:hypothetical protein
MSNARRAYRLVPPAVKTGRPHFFCFLLTIVCYPLLVSRNLQLVTRNIIHYQKPDHKDT